MASKNVLKKSEYGSWDEQTLMDKIEELTHDMQKMQYGHSVNPLENPMLLRTHRRNIAKLKTELNSRSL